LQSFSRRRSLFTIAIPAYTVALSGGSIWDNQGLLSSTSELAALLEGEPGGGIHNWWHPQLRHPEMAALTTGGIQKWLHPELAAPMISTWEPEASIYVLASPTHYSNSVRTFN